jgi:putative flippase GtrA
MSAASPKVVSIELVKFAIVGLFNTFLALAIIYSLKWVWQWGDVIANLVAYLACILVGFVLNGFWTFRKATLKTRHMLTYLFVVAVAYLINLGVVLLSIYLLGVPSDFAQLLGVPFFTVTSFVLNKVFVFSNKW